MPFFSFLCFWFSLPFLNVKKQRFFCSKALPDFPFYSFFTVFVRLLFSVFPAFLSAKTFTSVCAVFSKLICETMRISTKRQKDSLTGLFHHDRKKQDSNAAKTTTVFIKKARSFLAFQHSYQLASAELLVILHLFLLVFPYDLQSLIKAGFLFVSRIFWFYSKRSISFLLFAETKALDISKKELFLLRFSLSFPKKERSISC